MTNKPSSQITQIIRDIAGDDEAKRDALRDALMASIEVGGSTEAILIPLEDFLRGEKKEEIFARIKALAAQPGSDGYMVVHQLSEALSPAHQPKPAHLVTREHDRLPSSSETGMGGRK